MPSSVAAAWSSKSKVTTKTFSQRQPQARFPVRRTGRGITSCIPPLSSKNRSAMMVCCVGTVPENRLSRQYVRNRLLRPTLIQSALAGQATAPVVERAGSVSRGVHAPVDLGSERRHLHRTDPPSWRGFPTPKRNGGGAPAHLRPAFCRSPPLFAGTLPSSARVPARLFDHPQNPHPPIRPPCRRAGDHRMVGVSGNGAAGGDGRESGATTPPDVMVDAIMVEIGRPRPRLVANPSANIFTTAASMRPGEIAIGMARRHRSNNSVSSQDCDAGRGDNLLRQHIQRCGRHPDTVQYPASDARINAAHSDQFVAWAKSRPLGIA